MEVSAQLHAPAALSRGKALESIRQEAGLLGPRVGLGTVTKMKAPFPATAGNPARSLVTTLPKLPRLQHYLTCTNTILHLLSYGLYFMLDESKKPPPHPQEKLAKDKLKGKDKVVSVLN